MPFVVLHDTFIPNAEEATEESFASKNIKCFAFQNFVLTTVFK